MCIRDSSITLIEDSIIQGIIYSYVLKAKNNSINFNIDIQENITIVSEISSLDMSRILGILLDLSLIHISLIESAIDNC